jgi:FtsP/CotA-like multicopper oxidase with cupredoxin domain
LIETITNSTERKSKQQQNDSDIVYCTVTCIDIFAFIQFIFKKMVLLFLLICLSTISLANSVAIVNRRRVFHFTVAYAENSSSVVLINNQMPGPLIEAELNDIIIVHVTNYLSETERLSIHFHGMLVQQTPQMDGVGFITQMPIESQDTFTYVFRAYPAGTYFYHSHAGLQAVTAFGGIIVHDRRRPWNISEVPSGPLLFSDLWFEPDRLTQEHNLLASPFVWQGEPTYLLINGTRNFVLTVEPNKQYLLRLIGATLLSTIVFGIDEHPMTVVEVDGGLIKPKENVASIELSSGQRYAVIIQTKNQTDGIFLMQLSIRWRTLVTGSK